LKKTKRATREEMSLKGMEEYKTSNVRNSNTSKKKKKKLNKETEEPGLQIPSSSVKISRTASAYYTTCHTRIQLQDK